MTPFTGCPKTSFILRRERSERGRRHQDALEDDGSQRTTGRNPVKRGLVKEPGDWNWSSFRHYAYREMGVVEIESEWTARDRELKIMGAPSRIFLSPG
jgi:hypothetical protein